MVTIIVLILVILLLGGGFYGHRSYGLRGVLVVLVIALLVLAVFGFISDEIAVGPGVAPIMKP